MTWLLSLSVVDGPLVVALDVLAAALLGCLLTRRPTFLGERRHGWLVWFAWAGGAMSLGALIAMSALFLTENVFDVFNAPLPNRARLWVVLAFAGIALAVLNFWRSRVRRKVVAGVAVVVFLLTAALGVNAAYSLNPTLGVLLGMNSVQRTAVTTRTTPAVDPSKPLYETWHAPAGMLTSGQVSLVDIPHPSSGFAARPALLYQPPAALTSSPPPLPVMVMMMGQPGGPEQARILIPLLDTFAREHHGLAPIVLTVDQLGSPNMNPLCIDSRAGQVHRYVMDDVTRYVRSSLNTLQARQFWAVGGYSNGGECAFSFGAKHPDVFGAVLSIAGELEPSLGSPSKTVNKGFDGDKAGYEAEKPVTIVGKTRYSDVVAIFTAGGSDQRFSGQARKAADAATAAGMTTHLLLQPGGDHGGDMILYSFENGLKLLAPRFGLEKPAS